MKILVQTIILITYLLTTAITNAATSCPIGSTYTIKNADSVRFESDNPSIYRVDGNMITFTAPGNVNIKAYASFGSNEMLFQESLEITEITTGHTEKTGNIENSLETTNYTLLYTGTEYQVPPFILERHTQMVLHFVNYNRQQFNLRPLKLSERLCRLANIHAKKFSDTQTNTIPNNLNYAILGGAPSPEKFTNDCANSPTTIEKIFQPYFKEIGIGYYDDINCPHVYTWVLIFR